MTFPCFPQKHDPEDAKTFAFRFELNDGDEIISAIIDVVDETSTTVITGSNLDVENVRPGYIASAGAVFFRPIGGTPGLYWLRCTASTQLGDTYVQTLGLRVGQL
jgi:hypothetical protein